QPAEACKAGRAGKELEGQERTVAGRWAATTIQASWRGFLVRRQIATENAAASTIQAAWRRFITREYLAMQRDQADRERATVVLQAHYRGYVVRRTLRECSRAATTIQAHWRGYCVRRVTYLHAHVSPAECPCDALDCSSHQAQLVRPSSKPPV
uniref:Abnormal spindle-like microcephaly-associated protein n=1 Tax=Varanus komodoensis TaxID=61221 RepID=A0A8D2LSM1_VARKO